MQLTQGKAEVSRIKDTKQVALLHGQRNTRAQSASQICRRGILSMGKYAPESEHHSFQTARHRKGTHTSMKEEARVRKQFPPSCLLLTQYFRGQNNGQIQPFTRERVIFKDQIRRKHQFSLKINQPKRSAPPRTHFW